MPAAAPATARLLGQGQLLGAGARSDGGLNDRLRVVTTSAPTGGVIVLVGMVVCVAMATAGTPAGRLLLGLNICHEFLLVIVTSVHPNGTRPPDTPVSDLHRETLVGNGKQALSLVARELRDLSVRHLVAPDFHCQTMLTPFQLEGMDVTLCPTDASAALDPNALAILTGQPHDAVLTCETFGIPASKPLVTALTRLHDRGVPIIVDTTHSWLADRDRSSYADYEVASVRKLLPTPDGALVRGLHDAPTLRPTPTHSHATALAREALAAKRRWLDDEGTFTDYLDAFDSAETVIERDLTPASASPETTAYLASLDRAALLARLRASARPLLAALERADVVNRDTPECGVAVRVDDAVGVEQVLLEHEIICPISWPRPDGLPRRARWRNELVTLPLA